MGAMIKKRVAELEGAQLDWAVAMSGEEWKTAHQHYPTMTLDPTFAGCRVGTFGYLDGRSVCVLIPNNPMRQDPKEFSPSTSWEHGGPIIDRERISVWESSGIGNSVAGEICASVGAISGWDNAEIDGEHIHKGLTRLIAAMRAFVASKLGDEVEVPA